MIVGKDWWHFFYDKTKCQPPSIYTHTYKEIIYHHVCSRNTLFFFHMCFFLLLLLLVSPSPPCLPLSTIQPFWFCYGFPTPTHPPTSCDSPLPFPLCLALSVFTNTLLYCVCMYYTHNNISPRSPPLFTPPI